MTIAFFETEEWEKTYLEKKLSAHALLFFSHPVTQDSLSQITQCDILSVFIYSTLTKEFLSQLPNLKLISTRSTGYDHIDIACCKERHIPVSYVPVYGTNTVAEHTFALLLALSRKLIPSVERSRRGDFSLDGLRGFELFGKTVGVIGVGNIGKAVIQIAHGFGMNVLAYTKHPNDQLAKSLGVSFVDLPTLLARSDVISLHVPYTKETHHLINKENISQFKHGSILINTARGGLVETEAILVGLDKGYITGAGIDVLEEECMVKEERQLLTEQFLKECDMKTQLLNHVLLTKQSVIVTPHNAFNSREALQRILDTTIENIEQFTRGARHNLIVS